MSNSPVKIDSGSFQKVVLESSVPVLVDFWAPWCGPCRMIAPHLEALAQEMEGRIVIAKLNTDENPDLANSYQVTGIPTLMLFKDGKVTDRIVGAMSKDAIKNKVMEHIGTK